MTEKKHEEKEFPQAYPGMNIVLLIMFGLLLFASLTHKVTIAELKERIEQLERKQNENQSKTSDGK